MKKFIEEFKKFITRGNVMDMAVGVIIGTAFTAIVNAVTKNILQPVINAVLAAIFGSSSLSGIYTYLKLVHVIPGDPTSGIDLANSIYIDWGLLINAIINFLLTAIVLFLILKIFNKVKENKEKLQNELKKSRLSKKDKIELKKLGIKRSDKEAVKNYLAKKEEAELKALEEEKAKKLAEEEEAKKHTTEGLLEQIKTLLEENNKLRNKE